MKHSKFNPHFIPLILIFGYLIFSLFPYFFSKINRIGSLGPLSAVEEKAINIQKTYNKNRADSENKTFLLKGEKLSSIFEASEDNFGILLFRFSRLPQKVNDTVKFRIKEKSERIWYYENNYNADQFLSNEYFPFGFPPIKDSSGKTYVFEIESLSGTHGNGLGVGKTYPQVAAVYKYNLGELKNPGTFSSFIMKKITYVIGNINSVFNWQLLIILLIFFSPFAFTKNKRRIIIGLLIFLLAFSYRYSSSLIYLDKMFYITLGSGGDYDQFMRASTCSLNFCSWILHQNLLIESWILGAFYKIFGFVEGIKVYSYLMLLVSSIVATLPYLLLSRKTWFTIGGIIGSLFLATSDFLTQVALNFPPDNGSIFLFSIFFLVYLSTISYGTLRWLIALGLWGFFDGMFKAMFLINDLVVLTLFAPVYFYEKVRKIGLPIRKQLKAIIKPKNSKILFLSLLPLLIFLLLYSTWELLAEVKFSASYFLRGLIENDYSKAIEGNSPSTASFNEIFSRGILGTMYYYASSSVVMIKRIIENASLDTIFLAPVTFGLLFIALKRGKFFALRLTCVVIFAGLAILSLVLFRNNYLGIQEIGQNFNTWSDNVYINILLFSSIIFLFILNFRYQAFKLALPIIPYVVMLIILTKDAPWLRLLSHIIVWSIILLSFLADLILNNLKKDYFLKRFRIGEFLLILILLFYTLPKVSDTLEMIFSGINNSSAKVKYLRWVDQELPKNAIILAGAESNLPIVSENINRPIAYNASWASAVLIKPNEIPGVSPEDFDIADELKIEENFKKNKYLILEWDINIWRRRIAGERDTLFNTNLGTMLYGKDYSVEVYKFNHSLNEGVYELKIKEN